MTSKVSAVRTGSWAMLTLAGLACLASACSSSSTSGTGGATGSGGATGTGGSGSGGIGTGGNGAGGSGTGGSGTGGKVDAGSDTAVGPMDAARDAVSVHDGAVTAGGAYVRTGWTAVAMPDHVAPAQTNPRSNESLDSSNAFDGMNGTRWATGVFQSTLTFPLFFTVDMKQAMTVGRITLFAGTQDTGDYPVQMDVLVSTDGVNFTTAVAAHRPQPPASGIDTININPPVVAQWIQLKATTGQPATNNRWWAIGEMNVFP